MVSGIQRRGLHEQHRAKCRSRTPETAKSSDVHSGTYSAETRRRGIASTSLARIPDGGWPARCLHGLSLSVWDRLWIPGLPRPAGHSLFVHPRYVRRNLDGHDRTMHLLLAMGKTVRGTHQPVGD